MRPHKAACCILAGLMILVSILTACGPGPGDYVLYRVAQSAEVSAFATPDYKASQAEKDSHPGAVPFKIQLCVDPTVDLEGADEDATPILTTFGFVSDGLCFSQSYEDAQAEDEPGGSLSTFGTASGDDTSFVYAVWTQLPQEDAGAALGNRVWYRQLSLSTEASEYIPYLFTEEGFSSYNSSADEEGLSVRTFDLDGTDAASGEIDLFVNRGLLQWPEDPDADSDLFYVPLALLTSTTFTDNLPTSVIPPFGDVEPIRLNSGERYGSTSTADEDGPPPDKPVFLTEPETLTNAIEDGVIGPEVVIAGPASTYTCQSTDPDGDSLLYRWVMMPTHWETSDPEPVLVAPLAGPMLSAPFDGPLPRTYSGFPDITPVSGEDVQTGDTAISATVFVANGFSDLDVEHVPLIIHNIPVAGDLLFEPNEPHIVELPYTFWLTFGPVELRPQEPEPVDLTSDEDLLRMIVSPALGGSVTVNTPFGTREPDGPAQGDWQSSLAFDYTFGGTLLDTQVTLSAEPAEGYCFVAWYTDDLHAEIQDPKSPTTRLTIHPVVREEMGPALTTVTACFAAYAGEPPEDVFFDTMMGATIKPVSRTIEDESGCESIVSIDYEAVDLTGGEKPISYVQLNIDGEELTSWSSTPTDRYHNNTLVESDCSEVHVIGLKAINSEGQTMTVTKEAPIPPLSTYFEYGILDVPESTECQMQLMIDLQAVDLTVPDNPITNVVVKENGSTWFDSGDISTARLEHSLSKLVGCGHTYLIEVIGTDADGNTYTYRKTVEVPEGTPPDEPDDQPIPPPQTTLYAAMVASAQCTASGSECSCQLSVSFDGKDLTGGTYPVTRVVLRVNGQMWHDSGGISTANYHQVVTKTVSCGASFSLQLDVDNAVGQTATSTGSLTTPTP